MQTVNMAIVKDNGKTVKCEATVGDENACECILDIDQIDNKIKWTISSWFTKDKFKHQGIGKNTMGRLFGYCVSRYGIPTDVEYIWNGAHEYVMDWLEKHFDAVCTCPIAVQKTQADDDWDSHIYKLNTKKILDYFI